MLSTLMTKEIHETIITYRFLIALFLCLILIPLAMYVSLEDFERRNEEYQNSIRLYQEKSEGRINPEFQAEGFRPPSPLSVFSQGAENSLPFKVTTSRNGDFQIGQKMPEKNLLVDLFGKIDFAVTVSYVLSIMAIIFTFNCITGEKENGTLRLMIANSAPRWKVLMAKIMGNFLSFLLPFLIAWLIALTILLWSGSVQIFTADRFLPILFIFLVSIIFLFIISNLGVFISTRMSHSVTSMIVLLLIWVLMIFVVPKLSSMVAQIIYPIKSEQVLNSELQMAKRNLDEKYIEKRRQLLKDMLLTRGLNNDSDIFDKMDDPGVAGIFQKYDQSVVAIEQECEKEYASTVKRLEQDYELKKQTQTNIALFISRISPVCCYLNVLSELSGTGISELQNFTDHAQRFQHQVENEIYSKAVIKRYYDQGGVYTTVEVKPGVDRHNISVPILTDYKHVNLAQALTVGWIDILFLLLFSIILFAASYVSFLRYDVR